MSPLPQNADLHSEVRSVLHVKTTSVANASPNRWRINDCKKFGFVGKAAIAGLLRAAGLEEAIGRST